MRCPPPIGRKLSRQNSSSFRMPGGPSLDSDIYEFFGRPIHTQPQPQSQPPRNVPPPLPTQTPRDVPPTPRPQMQSRPQPQTPRPRHYQPPGQTWRMRDPFILQFSHPPGPRTSRQRTSPFAQFTYTPPPATQAPPHVRSPSPPLGRPPSHYPEPPPAPFRYGATPRSAPRATNSTSHHNPYAPRPGGDRKKRSSRPAASGKTKEDLRRQQRQREEEERRRERRKAMKERYGFRDGNEKAKETFADGARTQSKGRQDKLRKAALARPRNPPSPADGVYQVYQRKWATLRNLNETSRCRFHEIPWPVCSRLDNVEQLTSKAVVEFLRDPSRTKELSIEGWDAMRRSLRKEQVFWHPDKFDLIVANKVCAEDQEKARQAGILVTKLLNTYLGLSSERDFR